MLAPEAPGALTPGEVECCPLPEASALWPVVLILADIAARVERRRAEEHESGSLVPDDLKDEAA